MKVLIDLEFDSNTNVEEQLQEVINYMEDSLASAAISCKVISKAEEVQDIRDGYHSFKELYDHRIQLFVALCNYTQHLVDDNSSPDEPWKSKFHSDGTSWDGWFVAGINQEPGKQISYHLPIEKWDELMVKELPMAPKWDGHTPEDVLERLKSLR